MNNTIKFICALALIPVMAAAQFDTGASIAPPAWQSFKLNPKTRIKLDFRNSNADMVLALYQKASGVTIVKDPSLTGGLTITSAKAVSLNDAFEILNAVLTLKNFEIKKDGNLLVVRQKAARGGGGAAPAIGDGGDTGFGGGGGRNSSVLRVYPIKYANATEMARVLNEVFGTTDTGSNNNPFGGRRGGGMRGMVINQGGNQGGGGGGGRQGPVVRASSDDFSNSVIVNAPETQQVEVKDLIDKIDKQTEEPQQSRVFKLQYAVANDIAPVIQNVLVSNAPRGKGGATSGTNDFQSRFQQAIRLGSTQAAFGQVVADTRLNAVVVTATVETLDPIHKANQQLDTPVVTQTSTFVFPLQNARADQIATLMNQAFGSRSGTNSQQNQNAARTPNSTTTTNRNTTSTSRPPQLSGQVTSGNQTIAQNNPNQLELAMQDPAAADGQLLTSIGVQGGFFGGGGQFRGGIVSGPQNNSNTQPTGRDEQGKLVNVRDLVGQVTVIADPNTNSVIVVGAPDSAALIRGILDQLDKIPQQVMIETIIVEATLDAADKLGVEWSFAQGKAFGTPGANGTLNQTFGVQNPPNNQPAPSGFLYTLTSGNLSAFLNALRTDTKFQVLSTPRIFTSNNVQASINISQSIPYVLSSTTDAATGSISYNYAFQDVGIILTVTPRITSNGYVTMDVTQTANDLQGYTTFNAPIVNQREANTTVSVKDGETIILGGIIRNTVTATTNKIPLLGDIPLLGKLFQSSSSSKEKTELLVFLTPRVVRTPEEAKMLRESVTKELSPENQQKVKDKLPKDHPILGSGGGQ